MTHCVKVESSRNEGQPVINEGQPVERPTINAMTYSLGRGLVLETRSITSVGLVLFTVRKMSWEAVRMQASPERKLAASVYGVMTQSNDRKGGKADTRALMIT